MLSTMNTSISVKIRAKFGPNLLSLILIVDKILIVTGVICVMDFSIQHTNIWYSVSLNDIVKSRYQSVYELVFCPSCTGNIKHTSQSI